MAMKWKNFMTTETEFPEIIGRYFEGFCPACSNPAPFVGTNYKPFYFLHRCHYCNIWIFVDKEKSEVIYTLDIPQETREFLEEREGSNKDLYDEL